MASTKPTKVERGTLVVEDTIKGAAVRRPSMSANWPPPGALRRKVGQVQILEVLETEPSQDPAPDEATQGQLFER